MTLRSGSVPPCRVSDQAEASNGEATGQENPLLPDDPVGSLSEFGVPSTSDRPDEQVSSIQCPSSLQFACQSILYVEQ